MKTPYTKQARSRYRGSNRRPEKIDLLAIKKNSKFASTRKNDKILNHQIDILISTYKNKAIHQTQIKLLKKKISKRKQFLQHTNNKPKWSSTKLLFVKYNR